MSYKPTVWSDGETPVNAENLNNMEKGIAEAHEGVETAVKTVNGIGPDENGNVDIPDTAMQPLTFTGAVSVTYDGSEAVSVEIPTDKHINELINTALGVIENGTY